MAPGNLIPNFLRGYDSSLHLQTFLSWDFGPTAMALEEIHFQALKVTLLLLYTDYTFFNHC